jgi:citrate lyase subunit beta/citryl-CoA lyase
MLLMRTLLYVPVNRENMVQRAHGLGADVICLDLEDSVPPGEKEAARQFLGDAIRSLKAAGKSVHVRINHLDTGLTRDDVLAAVCPELDGLAFPKAEGAQDVRDLDVMIREAETKNGVKPGSVVLIPAIESARGVLRCEEIALASTRLAGIAMGAYDYAADLGVNRRNDGRELEYGRRVVVHCCAAYGLQAIDSPYADFRDEPGLVAETEYIQTIGFKGKYVIHPAQIDPVNRIFRPSDEDVEDARKVVAAFDEAVERGHASVQIEGRMIDTPVAKRARELIAYANEIAEGERRQQASSA